MSVLFLVAVISLPPASQCSLRVVSMRQRCLQYWQILILLLFLTHRLSTSSLGCKALVISFLINIIIDLLLESFSRQLTLVVFHWNQNDSKSPLSFGTLLTILADLNNPVVWMVSILPLISNSSGLFPCPWRPFQTDPHLHVPHFLKPAGKVQVLVYLFIFIFFHTLVHLNGNIY